MQTSESLPEVAHARRSDPETSHAAAASVRDLRTSQIAILTVFRHWGALTDERLIALYESNAHIYHWPRQSPSGLRSRRSELVRGGFLEWTGKKELVTTGRMARLWGVPPG